MSAEYVCNCVCIELYPSFPFFILLLLLIVCVAVIGIMLPRIFVSMRRWGVSFFCGGDGVLIWADVNYACNTAAVSTVSEGISLAPASPVVISV